MGEVRRVEDNELCGYVERDDAGWLALAVFGAVLGVHTSRKGATAAVLSDGLASLADRWTLTDAATGEVEVVCIVEANATGVTVARGYSSMPGVPTIRITRGQLAAGDWSMER